ncbi:MAG: peptidoglycan DD-metalloendopeptidase family protein, partial [Anaerolineae bacterium]|nr:peptidoglycan DD-metalloendopeptidase family protein [Anaerolineae bacterium]
MASLPDFFLINPTAWNFIVWDRFNVPRNYTFAPTKLQKHEGIDLRATDDHNNPVTVFAAQRGIVDKVGYSAGGYGNYVRIVHKWGDQTYVTWYGHLSSTTALAGQFVLAGQKIGIAGTTGFSTGVHLHLTLQHIGHGLSNYVVADVVDPEPYFRLDGGPEFEEAWFVNDITIPDGTKLTPGETFVKTWQIRNTGTTTWTNQYTLGHAGDEKMGAADAISVITDQVRPGQLTNVSVNFIAPTTPGKHVTTWMMCNAANDPFP